jgi:hypothetical protein
VIIAPRRGERPGYSATTAHLQALFPFVAQGGIGAPGAYIGTDAAGGAWAYDPWELYRARVIRSPNMLVLGGISYAKSTFCKTYLYRQRCFGRQGWVIDVKGEYGPLGEALGALVLSLYPGGEMRLNPLDRRGGAEMQLRLLRSVTIAALKRELLPEEEAGLRVALELVNRECGAGEPTLPMVVDALFHPREEMVASVAAADAEGFAEANRDSALALQRLCEGDLRGMFDGPTTPGIDFDAPLVILDLSAVRDSAALGVLMTCAGAWQQAILLARKEAGQREGLEIPKVISIVEEVWRVGDQIGVAEWLQSNFKLCRAMGIQNILSAHRLSDFGAVGAEGSREARIVENLIADAGTIVLYRQPPDQRAELESKLGRSRTEAELTMTLGLGEALWVVGETSELVGHRMSPVEEEVSFTDELMGVNGSGVSR